MSELPGFDYARLKAALGAAASRFDVEHLDTCDSTNSELQRRASNGAPSGLTVIARHQSAGRGRRGRRWQSTPGASLTFSLLWRMPDTVPLHGLSLVVGLAVAEALEALVPARFQLKWPNDIWLDERKLGGVLIEALPGSGGLVIGIGLNLLRDAAWSAEITQPFAALADAGQPPDRELALGTILARLAFQLDRFAAEGFQSQRESWQARNALAGREVEIIGEGSTLGGTCLGVAEDGALQLLAGDELIRVAAGDVSLRPVRETA